MALYVKGLLGRTNWLTACALAALYRQQLLLRFPIFTSQIEPV